MVMSVPIQYNRSTSLSTKAVHKNNCVSGRPAGWLKKVRLESVFFKFILANFFKKNMALFFHGGGGGGITKIKAARLASILATRWTGNRIFLWTASGMYASLYIMKQFTVVVSHISGPGGGLLILGM